MINALALLRREGRRLREDSRGLALLEFAFATPIVLTMMLTGAELTNYIITKMRVSQVALQIADNAARMGRGSLLESKKISEADINDLLTGAGLQASELDLYTRGRVTLSSVEEDPANAGKYRIRWQRCKGSKTAWTSAYTAGQTNLVGVGPSSTRLVYAPSQGATMYVEVRYEYRPLIKTSFSAHEIKQTASMMVRDRRDLTAVFNAENVTASTC